MEYYLAIKKEWNFVICSNMDGLGGHYTKWNWSEKESTVWNLKTTTNYWIKQERNRFIDSREQTSGYQLVEEKGRGNRQIGD